MKRFRITDDAIPGAHAQVWVQVEGLHEDPSRVPVRREEDGVGGAIALLPREWLVEVKPPSIDDPVDLPLEFAEDAEEYRMRIAAGGGRYQPALVFVADHARGLTAEQCRDAARALWLLGTEPQSGPIGTRHMGQPQGPVQVQRPGTGSD